MQPVMSLVFSRSPKLAKCLTSQLLFSHDHDINDRHNEEDEHG